MNEVRQASTVFLNGAQLYSNVGYSIEILYKPQSIIYIDLIVGSESHMHISLIEKYARFLSIKNKILSVTHLSYYICIKPILI